MKNILLIMILPLLFSCGVKRLAVNHADDLLTYQVTRKIPLYSEQKKDLERDIGNFLNSSKTSVSDILPTIDKLELEGSEEINRTYPKLEEFYLKLAGNFSNLLSKYLANLDSKQQKDLFEILDDENRELLKKEKEDRIDEWEDRFRSFFGNISGPQKQLLLKNADYFQERAKARLTRRVNLHEKLKVAYQQDISSESRKDILNDAFKAYQTESTKGNKNVEIIQDFLPTLSKRQKEHFRRHIEDVKELLKYFCSINASLIVKENM
jgi:hypothetical protein